MPNLRKAPCTRQGTLLVALSLICLAAVQMTQAQTNAFN
jgi:hypothetical protein